MVEIDQSKGISMRDLDPCEEGRARLEQSDEMEKVQIGPIVEKFTFIGRGLPKAMKAKLTNLLQKNLDLFA